MNKTRIFFILILSLCSLVGSMAFAQQPEHYRYVHGKKVAMETINHEYMITYEQKPLRAAQLSIDAAIAERANKFSMKQKQHERYVLRSPNFFDVVKQKYPFAHISSVFLNEDNREQFASNEILVTYPETITPEEIEEIEQEFNLQRIESEDTRWLGNRILYRLLPPFKFNSLEVANRLYEQGLVKRASVNWVYDLEFHSISTNDNYFGDQWNIGKSSLDKAWEVVTGSQFL